MQTETKKRRQGFAVMSPEQRREIARRGGIAAQQSGTCHKWTAGPDGTAREAGRKGGSVSRRTKKGQEGKV